ncbi:response regulator [Gulbenkiania mobilis]|uniref:histidine kinase n=1 Tax=Gulbenkiania mobilis TaxID=397457 RepID=A0ABY2CWR3_GULMO|nr:signal transduction histidine kinase [Gulbenkiania mobilis]
MNSKSGASPIDETSFRRVLVRNISLPIILGLVSSALFIGMIFYLMSASRQVTHSSQVIGRAQQVLRLAIDVETGLRGFFITGENNFLEPYNRGNALFTPSLAELKALVSDNPVQIQRLERINMLYQQWGKFAREGIAIRRSGQDVSTLVAAGTGKMLTDSIRQEFADFVQMEERLSLERIENTNHLITWMVGLTLLFGLVTGLLLAYMGRRELLRLSTVYGDALDKQNVLNAELEQQAWLRTGQMQVAERVIDQRSLSELADNVLQFFAEYLGASVGALYLVDDDKRIERIGSYALLEDDHAAPGLVNAGEGLLGQAVTDNRLVQLDEVPDNYLKVGSTLGDMPPRTVLIAPIAAGETVNAVVELGFMQALTPMQVELVRRVCDKAANAIEAARYRQRLQSILKETQHLNEELQVQQEELKAANEELEEQSRALLESQARLEGQQTELEQTNEHLEEQTRLLERQRDELNQRNQALNHAQRQLEEQANELRRASQYKSEFLANMSHELRTPLNSSLILAKLLAENPNGNLSEDQVQFAQSIYSAGNDLLNLINDILDLSKVEAGKLEIRPEAFSLPRLVDSLRNLFRPLADDKGLSFEATVAEDVAQTLYTDSQRLEQILKNLLSNAVKFTDTGSVRLAVSRDDDGRIRFAVNDSGIGIPPEQQSIIFEAFRQADGTTNRKYGGTGLGLSISRDLARLLGGSIEVDSQPGRGSTFTLTLPESYTEVDPTPPAHVVEPTPRPERPALVQPLSPVRPAVPETRPRPVPPVFNDDRTHLAGSGRTVLVIEDEPQFAQVLYDLAHEQNYKCIVAQGADEGYQMAQEFTPDAILLDMKLPDHSGLTVLERLKQNPKTRHIPVHVVSAEDRAETALHLGAVGYQLKPVTPDDIRAAFARLEAKLSQKVKRVLLVEDDPRQRESVSRLIADTDVEIVAVALAEDALTQLRTNVFDCMIIDLVLPDMQGSQLLERMTHEDICSFPPVIVYTGRELSREEEAQLMRYSRSIIIKGARSPERLLDEVTLFLHRVEADMPPERQRMLKAARNRERAFEGRTILVVDDDVRNIFALTSALEQKGAQVEIGRNGREALEKLDGGRPIDLVLMDIMMPEMDGYEAMRAIRKNPRLAKLPIIAVTAKAMKDDQERCLEAGANDYLAKPIELDRLLSLIRVWLPQLERA